MTSVVWFRHDLRVIDQPALQQAMEYGDQVHTIALITPEIWSSHGWGQSCTTWYIQTLESLRSDLEQLGIRLVIERLSAKEDPALLVANYAASVGATQVLFGVEVGLDERRRDARFSRLLEERGIIAIPVVTETAFNSAELRTLAGTPFRVFTPFRKSWDNQFQSTRIECADLSFDSTPAQDPEELKRPVRCLDDWKPGSEAALRRLKTFLDGPVHSYHVDRDRPDLEGTSTLSPWLAVGAISPITCLRPLVTEYGQDPSCWPKGPRAWQQELIWREFYRHLMMNFDRLSMRHPLHAWTDRVPWQGMDKNYQAWCAGMTGIDIVDAGMKQLQKTGWMHNRLRMICAMFLTKNLLVDWRLGESFFARHLIDYDFASNNGGWQWSSSTGADASPYFRVFNPDLQVDRFDPERIYCHRWLGGQSRPAPIVELKLSRAKAIAAFKAAKQGGKISAID